MTVPACRICGHPETYLLWDDDGGNLWRRCLACGSDSSNGDYPRDLYQSGYLAAEVALTGGMDARKEQLRSNIEWFSHYKQEVNGRDFLDVGCLEGAGMAVAQEHGWSVHGWDCCEDARKDGCTTIAPYFAASLFPQRYHAILCREVIEHNETPRQFLTEVHAALHKPGLLQIQTPRPWHEPDPIPYQRAHLQLYSPLALELEVLRLGFHVLDRRFWNAGQAWMLLKVDGF
jgi:hypothetical protein